MMHTFSQSGLIFRQSIFSRFLIWIFQSFGWPLSNSKPNPPSNLILCSRDSHVAISASTSGRGFTSVRYIWLVQIVPE